LRAFDSVKLNSSAAGHNSNEAFLIKENEVQVKRIEELETQVDDLKRKAEKER
jgi:hypothetical protein